MCQMYIIYPYVSYTVCPFSPVQVGMGMIQSMRTACFVYIKSLDFLRKSWEFDEPGDKILENMWVRKQNVEVNHQIHSNTFVFRIPILGYWSPHPGYVVSASKALLRELDGV